MDTITLPDRDTDWTWMDADRDVAWGDPDSYHGKLAAAYREAGWEPCYHDYGRTVFHFNVKIYGRWRPISDMLSQTAIDLGIEYDEVERVAETLYERELESWWENVGEATLTAATPFEGRKDYWADGRMGGWFHVSNAWAANHPKPMLELADYLRESVEYYASQEWVDYLKDWIVEVLTDDPSAGRERCHCCGQIKETT